MVRLAHVFFDNAAAVQAAAGKAFKIPDDTVIAIRSGREVTAGELRKLDKRTAEDKAHDQATNRLIELRKQFKAADEEGRKEIKAEAAVIAGKLDFERTRELAGNDWNDRSDTGGGIPDLNKVKRREADARARNAERRGDALGTEPTQVITSRHGISRATLYRLMKKGPPGTP